MARPSSPPRSPARYRPTFEALEARTVPATFVVNSTADSVDADPGDGVAADVLGRTTLRAAVMEANQLAGDDVIVLPAGTYRFTRGGASDDAALRGDLDISSRVTIAGAGAGVTVIDADRLDRVFQVRTEGNLTLTDMALVNGLANEGGGVFNEGTLRLDRCVVAGNEANGTFDHGGGIYNREGNLTVTDSTISGNTAGFDGGGVHNDGLRAVAVVTNSTVSGNTAGFGGGLSNVTGQLTVTNGTVSGNTAAFGGGLHGSGVGQLTVTSCTVTDNAANFGGGLYASGPGRNVLQNSIVAGNRNRGGSGFFGPDINGIVISLGHNLIGNPERASGFVGTDLVGVDPRLGPLADNGGPTRTHALLAGSQAIDAGTADGTPATDQRGFARPADGNGDGLAVTDIGAFEGNSVAVGAAPTDITLAPGSVPENAPAGTVVGTLAAIDPDAGDTHTFALVGGDGDADNARFTVVGNELRTAEVFDYEAGQSYSVRVRATDSTGLWVEQVLTVSVEDVDDGDGEVLVNEATAGRQEAPKVAVDGIGNAVVVWAGPDGDERGVFARRFDALGRPLGGEFRVNETTAGRQSQALVGADAGGNFVVVWTGAGDGDDGGVFARRYAADGTPLGGEFRVNTETAGDQTEVAFAMNLQGEFVVAWDDYDQDGSYLGVNARRFGADGTRAGGEFRVNTVTAGTQGMPKVAINNRGEFVVTWVSNSTGGSDREVYGQRFDAAGDRVGGEFRVNATVPGRQEMGAVGIDDFGRVVAAFIGPDGSYDGVYIQRIDANGTRLGGEVLVNTTVDFRQLHPALVVEPDGDFTVAWTSTNETFTEADVHLQRFAADGTRIGGETRMNATVAGRQYLPGLALTPSGQGVVVWEGIGPGDDEGIFLRRLGD